MITSDRLLRRVQRHASFASLLHTDEPEPLARTPVFLPSLRVEPAVEPSEALPEVTGATSITPLPVSSLHEVSPMRGSIPRASGRPPGETAGDVPQPDVASHEMVFPPVVPSPPAIPSAPAATQELAVQRAVAMAESTADARPSTPDTRDEENKNWRRLQQIVNLHREKTEQLDTATVQPPAGQTGETSSERSSPPQPAPADPVPSLPATPDAEQQPSVSPMVDEVRPLRPAAMPITPLTAWETIPPDAPLLPDAGEPVVIQRESLENAWPVQKVYRSEVAGQTESWPDNILPDAGTESPLPRAGGPSVPPSIAQSGSLTDESPTVTAFTGRMTSKSPPLTPTGQVTAQETPQRGPVQAADIQAALENVRPQVPSDSSIELIPPRYPRPAWVKQPTEPAPGPAQPSGAMQRATQVASTEPAPEVTPAEENPQSSGDEVVVTEIGALPADLWSILGYPPPLDRTTTGMESESDSLSDTSKPSSMPAGNNEPIAGESGYVHRPEVNTPTLTPAGTHVEEKAEPPVLPATPAPPMVGAAQRLVAPEAQSPRNIEPYIQRPEGASEQQVSRVREVDMQEPRHFASEVTAPLPPTDASQPAGQTKNRSESATPLASAEDASEPSSSGVAQRSATETAHLLGIDTLVDSTVDQILKGARMPKTSPEVSPVSDDHTARPEDIAPSLTRRVIPDEPLPAATLHPVIARQQEAAVQTSPEGKGQPVSVPTETSIPASPLGPVPVASARAEKSVPPGSPAAKFQGVAGIPRPPDSPVLSPSAGAGAVVSMPASSPPAWQKAEFEPSSPLSKMAVSPEPPSIVPDTPAVSPAHVQRSPVSPAEPELDGAGGAVSMEPQSFEAEEGEDRLDVEELTRRVYLDIKRRLAREWERARGWD